MFEKGKEKKALFYFGLAAAILAAVWILLLPRKAPPPAGFNRDFEEFAAINRRALMPRDQDRPDWPEIVGRSYAVFNELVKRHKFDRPPLYARTTDWAGRLEAMRTHQERAAEAALAGRPEEAAAELLEARRIWRAIRLENGLLDLSAEMFELCAVAKQAAAGADKTAVREPLLDLKRLFAGVKDQAGLSETAGLDELEEAIAVLDRSLDGPDFQSAQANLADVCANLYYNLDRMP